MIDAMTAPLTTDRQRSIAGVAAQLFRQQGYRETTVRDIAAAAGVKSASLYYHFPTKDHILHAISLNIMEEFLEEVTGALDREKDPVKAIEAVVSAHLRFDAVRLDEVLVSARERRSLPPDLQQPINAARARHQQALRNVVAAGVHSNEFHVHDVEIATNAVLDMLQGVKEWGRHLFADIERVIDEYQRLALATLGANSGGDVTEPPSARPVIA